MKNLGKTFKKILSFMLGVLLSVGMLPSVLATEMDTDLAIRNPGSVTLEDGVELSKTAEPVEGYVNKYKVTLRVRSPRTEKTSDTVIVIDRSGSMKGEKMAKAKEAAKSLAGKLLSPDGTTNRVAVVSFAENVTTDIGFSSSYNTVANVINGLDAKNGTFTQAAIRRAADLISGSIAESKNIVFLSDGEPTYSCKISVPDNYLIDGGPGNSGPNVIQKQTSTLVPKSEYDCNTRIENGSSMWYRYARKMISTNSWEYDYYNHGNSAIAEAGFYKASSNGNLYTIALDAGENGTAVLNSMASAGKSYTAGAEDLKKIFDEISGSILSKIQSARITDVMGQGVVVSGTGAESLVWDLTVADFTYDEIGKMYVAEKTYVVEFTDSLDLSVSSDGFFPLNTEAVIKYADFDGNISAGVFPVPEADPMAIKITKKVIDSTGKSNGARFEVKLTDPDGTSETKIISNNETAMLLRAFRIGNYKVEEIGAIGEVDLENYLISYNGANFTIVWDQVVDAEVTVTNKYEEIELIAEKRWNDDNDRDGKRSDYNLYVAVKDGDNYIGYKSISPNNTTQSFTFGGLPKYRNYKEIKYEIVEARGCGNGCIEFAGDKIYAVSIEGGIITNTHVPEMKKLTIKKIWDVSAGTLPTIMPKFITVEVGNDKNNTTEIITLSGEGGYGEWVGEFSGYKYENGEEINYSVKETNISGGILNNENTLYIYNDDALEGKWVASYVNSFDIKNTWTPATSVYNGETKFTIKKINENGEVVDGIVFEVNGNKYVTNEEGEFGIEIKGDVEKAEESFKYRIKEAETLDEYDLIEGVEVLKVTTTSSLESIDEKDLINNYAKEFKFEATGLAGYVWNDGVYIVTNNRSMAEALVIEKEFEGVTADELIESELSFTIDGPIDFETRTVGFGEFIIEDGKAIYVLRSVPTGQYTVIESGGVFEGVLDLVVSGDNDVIKDAEKGVEVRFNIKNTYTPVPASEEPIEKDPCVIFGGCGDIKYTTPNTGRLTNLVKSGGRDNDGRVSLTVATMVIIGVATVFGVKIFAKRR